MARALKADFNARVVAQKQCIRVSQPNKLRRLAPFSSRLIPKRVCISYVRTVCAASISPVSEAEHLANERRKQESGTSSDASKKWQWSLNWDQVARHLIVGSCPRSNEDVETIFAKAGADAIVCLQCNDCLEALRVDLPSIRQRAAELGMTHVQVAIRDFDRPDQARMLPEAVLQIALLIQEGKTVYVHCTAGINRAPLAAIGYLSFVKGMDMWDAVKLVKSRRPQARPYEECLQDARANILLPEKPTLEAVAKDKYEQRVKNGEAEDGMGDWVTAERETLQMLFKRRMTAALSHRRSVQAGAFLQDTSTQSTIHSLEREVTVLQQQLQKTQEQLQAAAARVVEPEVVYMVVEDPIHPDRTNALEELTMSMPTTEAELLAALKRLVEESTAALTLRSGCLQCAPGKRLCGSLCIHAHPIHVGADEE